MKSKSIAIIFLIFSASGSDFTPGDVGFVRINQFLHSLDIAQLVNLID